MEQADRARQRFGLAQKGGRAEKSDPLQKLVLEIVRKEPNIGFAQLLSKLKQHERGDVIEEIAAGEIHFKGPDGEAIAGGKRIKDKVISYSAEISALKHRLTRARKKIRSEMQSR